MLRMGETYVQFLREMIEEASLVLKARSSTLSSDPFGVCESGRFSTRSMVAEGYHAIRSMEVRPNQQLANSNVDFMF